MATVGTYSLTGWVVLDFGAEFIDATAITYRVLASSGKRVTIQLSNDLLTWIYVAHTLVSDDDTTIPWDTNVMGYYRYVRVGNTIMHDNVFSLDCVWYTDNYSIIYDDGVYHYGYKVTLFREWVVSDTAYGYIWRVPTSALGDNETLTYPESWHQLKSVQSDPDNVLILEFDAIYNATEVGFRIDQNVSNDQSFIYVSPDNSTWTLVAHITGMALPIWYNYTVDLPVKYVKFIYSGNPGNIFYVNAVRLKGTSAPPPSTASMPPYVFIKTTDDEPNVDQLWFNRGTEPNYLIREAPEIEDYTFSTEFRRLGVDSNGYFHVSWIEYDGELATNYYSNSTNGGLTWSTPMNIDPSGVNDLFITGMAVDILGGIHFSGYVWNDTVSTLAYIYLNSTTKNISYELFWDFTDPPVPDMSFIVTNICVDYDGVPHIVWAFLWEEDSDYYYTVMYANSTLGAISTPVVVSEEEVDEMNSIPLIDALNDGSIVVEWITRDPYYLVASYGLNGEFSVYETVFSEDWIGNPSLIVTNNIIRNGFGFENETTEYFGYIDDSSGSWGDMEVVAEDEVDFSIIKWQMTYDWPNEKVQGVSRIEGLYGLDSKIYLLQRNSWDIIYDQPILGDSPFSVLWNKWGVIIAPKSFEITNMDASNWLFSETKYYVFVVNYDYNLGWNYLDSLRLDFNDEDGLIRIQYRIPTARYTVLSGDSKVVLRIISAENTSDTNYRLEFGVYFTKNVYDTFNVDFYVWANSTAGGGISELIAKDYCNIYNLGGATKYVKPGDQSEYQQSFSNHPYGSDPLSIQTTGVGWMEAQIIYKNLQHIGLLAQIDLPSVQIDDQYGYNWMAYYGISYYIHGEWVNGWYVTVELTGGADASKIHYVSLVTRWYYGNTTLTMKSQQIFSFYRGGQNAITLWTDLWISNTNSSSAVAGRINAEYYGMTNSAAWWQFWYSDWGPMFSNDTQNSFEVPLRDGDGNVTSSRDIELQVFYTGLNKAVNTGPDYNVTISAPSDFDVKVLRNGDSLIGIPTPPFVPPKVMDMPQGGLFGLLQTFLSNIVAAISQALMPAWATCIAILDAIFAWAGWPGGFTQITTWISQLAGFMVSAMGWMMTMLTGLFAFFTVTVPAMLYVVTSALTIYIDMIGKFWGFFTGLYGTGFDVWNDFGGTSWVTIGILIYPVYLLLLWTEHGLGPVMVHLDFWGGLIMGLVNLAISLAGLVWSFISGLIENIPVVE